jgi:serine phosphatase RsbU (regulator of sigma subunit)
MKIRTQLVLAFLLLAVVPLSGIVLYSYAASLRAVRGATEAQASNLTREMDGRMAAIRTELGRGVERMGEVPMRTLLSAAESGREGRPDPVLGRIVREFGQSAPLLDSVEIVPMEPATAPFPAEIPAPEAQPAPAPAAPAPAAPGAEAEARAHPGRIVIDIPRIMREAMEESRAAARAVPPGAGVTPEETEAAIEAAMEAIEGMTVQMDPGPAAAPVPPRPPGTPEAVEGIEGIEGIPDREAMRQQVQEQLAKIERQRREAEERRVEIEKRLREVHVARGLEAPVWEGGKVVGTVKVRLRDEEVLRRVLERTRGSEGDVPFALDTQGRLHTVNAEDRAVIESLPLDRAALARQGSVKRVYGDWAVATSRDKESGLVFGIARKVPLEGVRRTAARNLGYGLGLVGLALLGILPLSARMARNVEQVTAGAERIAQGDLTTRVPVRSRNEFGTLALAFNKMAEDLGEHQRRLLQEERLRKESEIEQRLLKTEYDRKTQELEEARRFQLSLLPKTLPVHPAFEIAVSMRTATEVGGDYYDFHLADDGTLTAAIGDATGHGAAAGTMVTAIKSLFSASAGEDGLSRFLTDAARAVKRMDLGRMAMALSLVRLQGRTLTVSNAGMPPILLHRRASGRAEEIALQGMPLGSLAYAYEERTVDVAPGDTILLLSDGLPELPNPQGDPLGYPRARTLFEGLAEKSPEDIIAGLTAAAEHWAGGGAPKDDVTLVVVRVG